MPEWICQICGEHDHPIILCGHTYCETCLGKVNVCPSCRIRFNQQTDLQSMRAVVDSKNLPLKRKDWDRGWGWDWDWDWGWERRS